MLCVKQSTVNKQQSFGHFKHLSSFFLINFKKMFNKINESKFL